MVQHAPVKMSGEWRSNSLAGEGLSRIVGATLCGRPLSTAPRQVICRSGGGPICMAWQRQMAGDHTGSPLRYGTVNAESVTEDADISHQREKKSTRFR